VENELSVGTAHNSQCVFKLRTVVKLKNVTFRGAQPIPRYSHTILYLNYCMW